VAERWRVGCKVGRTLYINDELVGLMDTPELARRVVSALSEPVSGTWRFSYDGSEPEANLACSVRASRIRSGMTQRDLADALRREGFSMHQTTVAKLEAAERPIRVNEAAALARIFNVSLTRLLDEVTPV